jgi:hypothetical protein
MKALTYVKLGQHIQLCHILFLYVHLFMFYLKTPPIAPKVHISVTHCKGYGTTESWCITQAFVWRDLWKQRIFFSSFQLIYESKYELGISRIWSWSATDPLQRSVCCTNDNSFLIIHAHIRFVLGSLIENNLMLYIYIYILYIYNIFLYSLE